MRIAVRYLVPAAGAALMLVGAIVLATRPSVEVPPGRDLYIGYATVGGGPDLTVPMAIALVVVGFCAVIGSLAWQIVASRRSRG